MERFRYITKSIKSGKIEIWKYSPFILAKDNIVDPLSLIMTLKNENDERIQEAVESLLKKVW